MTRPISKDKTPHSLNGVRCFLSFSTRDGTKYAQALATELKKLGASVNQSNDDRIGRSAWADVIRNTLSNSDVLVLIGTVDAFRSQWVRSEIEFFVHRGAFILPIIFRETGDWNRIPEPLRSMQWALEESTALHSGPTAHTLQTIVRSLYEFRKVLRPEQITTHQQAKEQSNAPLNEGKLILVGRGEVGKTSLVRRLVNNHFRADESKTDGIIEACMIGCHHGQSSACV